MMHSKFSFAPRSPSLLTPPIEKPDHRHRRLLAHACLLFCRALFKTL
jgi:hypothetical protein